MSKNLYIVDYIGNCNENNQPIGHPIKVVNEFFELLRKDINVGLAIPIIYKSKINDVDKAKEIIWFERVTQILRSNRLPKITLNLNKIKNIKQVIYNCKYENIWFINADFCLGVALTLYKKKSKNKNIIVTLYMNNYDNIGIGTKIKNYFYQKIIKNASVIIASSNNLSFNAKKIEYIPDYFYSDNLYGKYKNVIKENKVVCVGTMNKTKELETLISVFNRINIKLYIIGSFSDKEQFDKCNLIKKDNIIIENKIVTKEEYYNLIASSKYVIIPYKMEQYTNRTSGVLLETMFLGSIPIAPEFLLDFNNIKGVGYNSLNELINFFSNEKEKNSLNCINNIDKINEVYMDKNIRNKILKLIK